MGRIAIHIVNGLLLVLFVWSAVMQYNDPDPVLWMSIYGTAALCCALYVANRLPVRLAAILSVVYIFGGFYLLLRILGPGSFFDETGQEMMGMQEESREMIGLFIAAAWTGFLAWWIHRHPASQSIGNPPKKKGA